MLDRVKEAPAMVVVVTLPTSLEWSEVLRPGEGEVEREEEVQRLDSGPVHRDVQQAAYLRSNVVRGGRNNMIFLKTICLEKDSSYYGKNPDRKQGR